MIRFLRTTSTRRLLALIAAAAAVVIGGTALALAAGGGGPKPPAEPLPVAVHDALTAPPVDGVSGRLKFTNHLISNSDVQGGNPVLSGASGRFWASADGHVRLELQADAGGDGGTSDTQVLSDGRRVTVFDSGSNTVYEATLPKGHDGRKESDKPPTLEQVKKAIARLAEHASVGGAEPSNVAGEPAYTVRIEPKQHGGLLGGAELAWDAAHGTPLRLAVYAKGDSSPVLQLEATDISYGPVSSSVFDVHPPSDAKVVDLSPDGGQPGARGHAAPVTGLDRVQGQVSFPIGAPAELAGMQRDEVRLIRSEDDPGALVTYGKGLDGIAVIEQLTKHDSSSEPSRQDGQVTLPTVSINGTQAEELATPLGTMIRFERSGVEYTVLGSVTATTAETAARALG